MIVEAYRPYIEQLLNNEPWRAEEGEGDPCPGAIDWDGSRFWHCTACGKVGTCTSQVHAPARNPRRVLIPFAVGFARAVSRPSPLACAPHGALFFSPGRDKSFGGLHAHLIRSYLTEDSYGVPGRPAVYHPHDLEQVLVPASGGVSRVLGDIDLGLAGGTSSGMDVEEVLMSILGSEERALWSGSLITEGYLLLKEVRLVYAEALPCAQGPSGEFEEWVRQQLDVQAKRGLHVEVQREGGTILRVVMAKHRWALDAYLWLLAHGDQERKVVLFGLLHGYSPLEIEEFRDKVVR